MKKLKDIFGKKERSNEMKNMKKESANPFHKHDTKMSETGYRCPMGCEGDKIYDEPGRCPVCNMELVPVEDVDHKKPGKHGHQHHMN